MHQSRFVPAKNYVRQQVDLAPAGATVAITVDSDNPFEDNADELAIYTQESGGMSGPDPGMRSRRGARGRKNRMLTGKAQVIRTRASAAEPNAAWAPGRTMSKAAKTMRRMRQQGFIPGIGDLGEPTAAGGPPAGWSAPAATPSVAVRSAAPTAANSSPAGGGWAAALRDLATGGAKVTGDVLQVRGATRLTAEQARIAEAQARAAEAATGQSRAEGAASTAMATIAQNKFLIMGVLAVVGVGAFMLLRKKR